MRKYLIIIPLIFLIVLSGCVNKGGEETQIGQGVVISEFMPSTDVALGGGKTVILRMEVENKGSYPAKNVMACIFGPLDKSDSAVHQGMWQLKGDQCEKLSKELPPFDEDTGQGGMGRFRWEIVSPYISYPEMRTDTFKGRVYYEYQSTATVTIPVYSESEYMAARQKGEKLKEGVKIIKSVGPVDLDIYVPEPVIAEDRYFSIKITVRNTGGGIVFDPEKAFSGSKPNIEDKIGIIRLSYTVPSDLDIKCDNQVEMFTGTERSITCDVNIKNPEDIIGVREFPITIKARYGYYIEKSADVSVEKTR